MVTQEKRKHYPEYIRHIKIDIPKRIETHFDEMGDLVSSTVNQIMMKQVERIDNELCKQIHDIAVSSGIDEVYVLDKRTILSALEKQIPRKPVPTPQPCKSRFACSICDKRLYSKQKFCDRCGQALDWSDAK